MGGGSWCEVVAGGAIPPTMDGSGSLLFVCSPCVIYIIHHTHPSGTVYHVASSPMSEFDAPTMFQMKPTQLC